MPESEKGQLRLLQPADIPAAFALSGEAGWNQTEDDWNMLLRLAPGGCFAIELDGRLAATTTLICYGRQLAWIGMVLTAKNYRRRGLARRLLIHALVQADQMGVETIKLDATEQGAPLYEELGFRSEQPVERWSRPGEGSAHFPTLQPSENGAWRESDTKTFGADRSSLLEMLARRNRPLLISRSYLFFRPGRVTAYLGPCVSENPDIVRHLVQQCVQETGFGWSWDLLPRNQDAVNLARDLGFVPQRHLVRMARGKELQQKEDATYAIAGFELG